MEEFLMLMFQVLIELFINVPWDWFWYGDKQGPAKESKPVAIGVASLFIGAGLGAISLLLFPDVIAKRAGLRLMLLFFAPVFSGTTAYCIARWRAKQRRYVVPSQHFWWSFLFSLGYVVIRFTYASRP